MIKLILKGFRLISLFIVLLYSFVYSFLYLETRILYPFLAPNLFERIFGVLISVATFYITYRMFKRLFNIVKGVETVFKSSFEIIIVLLIIINFLVCSIIPFEVRSEPPEDSELMWKFKDSRNSKECLLSDIKSIRVKRTTRGLLREIRIGISGTKFLYINGLEEFEEFINDLISANKNVTIVKFKELIDFDHPLYYVFFGTTVGIVTTLFFRFIPRISENNMKYVQLIFAAYLIFTGLFLLINKPFEVDMEPKMYLLII